MKRRNRRPHPGLDMNPASPEPVATPLPRLAWQCRDRRLECGPRRWVMGILNVTPDSFSDGGHYQGLDQAVVRALQMQQEGAEIIDVGGASTRPGALDVPLDEECRRVIPVIKALHSRLHSLISVDTTKAEVARRALEAGAHIINDISAMTLDAAMPAVARDYGAGVVLMHMQGTPRTMQAHPAYENVVGEVQAYLAERLGCLVEAGLALETLVVDPGIGFGKTVAHNLRLLAGMRALRQLGRPVLAGLSRKSFLGKLTGREVPERLAATLAASTYALLQGADILRAHDVKETCDLARIVEHLRTEEQLHEGVADPYTPAGA